MSKKRINIDDALISRYLAGDATERQKVYVEQWVDDSAQNRLYFQGLKELWNESAPIIDEEHQPDVDVDAAWSGLKAKIRNDQKDKMVQPKRRVLTLNYFYRVAAVFLLIASLYFIYRSLGPGVQEVMLSATEMMVTDSLPDGSVAQLNEGAVITYIEGFPENERKVAMTGEVYFEIKPDPQHGFEVQIEGALIRVLGTAFNVKAIEGAPMVEVAVREGTVELQNKKDHNTLILRSGETGIIDRNKQEMRKLTSIAPEVFYWNTKTLIFRDTPLKEVLATLSRVYGQEVSVTNNLILECKLSGRFRGDDLGSILKNIVLNFDLKVREENGQFIITGDGC